MGPGLTLIVFFVGNSSQNTPKPVLIFWNSNTSILSVYYTLLKVVSNFDLSVLKKVWIGGGWVG